VDALHRDPLSISCAATNIKNTPGSSLETYLNSLVHQKSTLDRCVTAKSSLAMQMLSVSTMLATNAIPVELFLGSLADLEQVAPDAEAGSGMMAHDDKHMANRDFSH
jgi:hypothetical protein